MQAQRRLGLFPVLKKRKGELHMRNVFIQAEITNMKLFAETFTQRCEAAAVKDDGKIDAGEAKILKKVNAATSRFLKELSKIK